MYFIGFVLILLFSLYVGFETLKQKLYFYPDTNCDNYPNIYKNVFIEENDFNIHGWLYESQANEKIIIFFHGNAGNIGNRQHIMKEWSNQGYSIFIFDYPGYGLSKGNPTEKSLYASAELVLKYVLKFKQKKNIVLYGESIGCSVATHIANKFNMNNLVLQSGFSSIKEVGKDFIPHYLQWLLYFIKDFDTYKELSTYNGKTLVLHSKDDEIIPFHHAETLRDFSELYEIHGSHNNPVYEILKIVEFIEK
jgi:esterase/lipase